jgi:hypothetical protein
MSNIRVKRRSAFRRRGIVSCSSALAPYPVADLPCAWKAAILSRHSSTTASVSCSFTLHAAAAKKIVARSQTKPRP